MKAEEWFHAFDDSKHEILEGWKKFISFKSISTDPAYDQDCTACAEWVLAFLTSIGFEGELLPTGSKPVVYARRKGSASAPKILYYGHYDVQPVDPLELWETDPFDATIKGDRLYARGAQDNKGQTFYVLKALERLVKLNRLDSEVTLLIEGEEECGSQGIQKCLSQWAGKIKADVLMVCDTGALAPGIPFITMGLRGLVAIEVTLGGISHDLHSGALGGVVMNPITELSKLIASLYHPDGSIAVEGYYDEVRHFTAQDRELSNRYWFPPEAFKQLIGVPPLGGEQNYTAPERRGMRPTIELNGIFGGYQGPGSKTIIPAFATAKITSRLVADQNPERCLALLESHLKNRAPKGLTLTIGDKRVGGPALALNSSAPLVKRAGKILSLLSDKPVGFTWEGGSIPIVSELAKISGAQPLLVGFGLEEDHIHAPNESFALTQFRLGYAYAGLMIEELAKGQL